MTQNADYVLKVAVWTDGMGTYQARCMSCDWKGAWWRKQERALKDAEAHTHGGK
jgi:hypothetical protein